MHGSYIAYGRRQSLRTFIDSGMQNRQWEKWKDYTEKITGA